MVFDLKIFCASEDSYKYNLTQPWTRGEFTYATDGVLIARVPALPDIPENDLAPNPTSLNWDNPVTDEQWLKLDGLDLMVADCENCNGGEDTPHDCPCCKCECDECDNGKVFKEPAIKVGSKNLNPRYLAILKNVPGILIAPDATTKEMAVPFKFDGGCGLLMPMRD